MDFLFFQRIRQYHGYSQAGLAKIFPFSYSYIVKVESGSSFPSKNYIREFCKFFDIEEPIEQEMVDTLTKKASKNDHTREQSQVA